MDITSDFIPHTFIPFHRQAENSFNDAGVRVSFSSHQGALI